MVVGDRQVENDRALLAAEEAAPAPGQRRGAGAPRAPTIPDTTSGFRAYNREAAIQLHGRLEVHLHARVDHPGGQDARGHRPRADPDEPEDARVAPVPVDVGLRPPQRARDLPDLLAVRAAARLHDRGRDRWALAARSSGAASPTSTRRGRGRRPRPVADPRRRAVHRRRAARGARRRWATSSPACARSSSARSSASAASSCSSASSRRTTSRAAGGRRAPTTGAEAGRATGKTDEREALKL